ncbi:MAG: hypothetical protein PHV36_02495 [Elusimicrobiales bacterium]|nr:hypothetical protein [Elusimicrobiales bacterium]
MKKNTLWILSFIITLAFAMFQRMTGPTYPVRGHASYGSSEISYRFPRSCTVGGADCVMKVKSAVPLQGYILWKRYKSSDEPLKAEMEYADGVLSGSLPGQPPAGKLEYRVFLHTPGGDISIDQELSKTPVVTRFKGAVPIWALLPHIVFIFSFMFFSVRIFLSLFAGDIVVKQAVVLNLGFLLLGGFLFGPIVQQYAFGQAWTGFPFGMDLTDNKTLIMLVFWLPALFAVLKQKNHKPWIILAVIVTFAVYLVPHSMFGSELDYAKGEVTTGK